MNDNKEIVFGKVTKESWIDLDKKILSVFNPYDTQPSRQRDRGDDITLLMQITHYLNMNLNQNPELTELTIPITYKEFMKALAYQPIQNKKVRLGDLQDIIRKINSINTVLFLGDDKIPIKVISIYSMISVTDWTSKNATFNIELNPLYIEYYKEVRDRTTDYFKLTLDIMLSLNTRTAKILYGYLSAYHDQMTKYSKTNKTDIDELKYYLDESRTMNDEGEWEYTITAQHLVDKVEKAIKQINAVIISKSELYKEYYPIYKFDYYRENPNATRGKGSEITSFRFSIDKEYEKSNKNKYKAKSNEPTVAQIINNSPFTQPVKDALYNWYKYQNNELNACIKKDELQQSIANLSKYTDEKTQLELINNNEKTYRVIAGSDDYIKSLKCNQSKITVQSKEHKNSFNHEFTNTETRRRRITDDDLERA